MYIGYSEEQEALRRELRGYYETLLTPEIRERLHRERGVGETRRAVVRQMGADGWLGIGWPAECGGQGRSQVEQFIFFDESMRSARVLSAARSVPAVGSVEPMQKWISPRRIRGREACFCSSVP